MPAIDPRILEKFQIEFDASKDRAAGYQTSILELESRLAVLQDNLIGETNIQDAINQALIILGEEPLS